MRLCHERSKFLHSIERPAPAFACDGAQHVSDTRGAGGIGTRTQGYGVWWQHPPCQGRHQPERGSSYSLENSRTIRKLALSSSWSLLLMQAGSGYYAIDAARA